MSSDPRLPLQPIFVNTFNDDDGDAHDDQNLHFDDDRRTSTSSIGANNNQYPTNTLLLDNEMNLGNNATREVNSSTTARQQQTTTRVNTKNTHQPTFVEDDADDETDGDRRPLLLLPQTHGIDNPSQRNSSLTTTTNTTTTKSLASSMMTTGRTPNSGGGGAAVGGNASNEFGRNTSGSSRGSFVGMHANFPHRARDETESTTSLGMFSGGDGRDSLQSESFISQHARSSNQNLRVLRNQNLSTPFSGGDTTDENMMTVHADDDPYFPVRSAAALNRGSSDEVNNYYYKTKAGGSGATTKRKSPVVRTVRDESMENPLKKPLPFLISQTSSHHLQQVLLEEKRRKNEQAQLDEHTTSGNTSTNEQKNNSFNHLTVREQISTIIQHVPAPSSWRLSDFEVRAAVIGSGALGKVYLCRLKQQQQPILVEYFDQPSQQQQPQMKAQHSIDEETATKKLENDDDDNDDVTPTQQNQKDSVRLDFEKMQQKLDLSKCKQFRDAYGALPNPFFAMKIMKKHELIRLRHTTRIIREAKLQQRISCANLRSYYQSFYGILDQQSEKERQEQEEKEEKEKLLAQQLLEKEKKNNEHDHARADKNNDGGDDEEEEEEEADDDDDLLPAARRVSSLSSKGSKRRSTTTTTSRSSVASKQHAPVALTSLPPALSPRQVKKSANSPLASKKIAKPNFGNHQNNESDKVKRTSSSSTSQASQQQQHQQEDQHRHKSPATAEGTRRSPPANKINASPVPNHLSPTTSSSSSSPIDPASSFFVSLFRTFSDEKRVYFILEHAAGGELFARLRSESRFPVEVARFYIAEIIIALDYLHNKEKIVFRDLQPDNILLDAAGHVKICDFGNAKGLSLYDNNNIQSQPQTSTSKNNNANKNLGLIDEISQEYHARHQQKQHQTMLNDVNTQLQNASKVSTYAATVAAALSNANEQMNANSFETTVRTFTICGAPEYTAPEIIAPALKTVNTISSSSPTFGNNATTNNNNNNQGFYSSVVAAPKPIYEIDGIGTGQTTSTASSSSPPQLLTAEQINTQNSSLFQGHAFAVDWWSVGVLLFEMVAGHPPFFDDVPSKIFEKAARASRATIPFPPWFDTRTMDLITGLLQPDPTKRLGSLKRGVTDIMKHRFFAGIDWMAMRRKQVAPPEMIRDSLIKTSVVPHFVMKRAAAHAPASSVAYTIPSNLFSNKSGHLSMSSSSTSKQNNIAETTTAASTTSSSVQATSTTTGHHQHPAHRDENHYHTPADIADMFLGLPYDKYPDTDVQGQMQQQQQQQNNSTETENNNNNNGDGSTKNMGALKPLTEAQQALFEVFGSYYSQY